MEKKNVVELSSKPILQVMICTYGKEGIERVAVADHPHAEGVEYLVSWQRAGATEVPKALLRDDFKIVASDTKGLSKNRNIALSNAIAPLLLVSDDDVEYTKERLQSIIKAFDTHPDADIITFRYETDGSKKFYPQSQASLASPPKGYFVSSIEIAMRRDSVQDKIWFNENFGIGGIFPSGEEDVFIRDCLDSGLNGIFLPITIARHDDPTTSGRNLMLPSRPQTKGAVFLRIHPHSWPLRMMAHVLREIPLWRKGKVPSPISYCFNWLKGAKKASKAKVFPTSKPMSHE